MIHRRPHSGACEYSATSRRVDSLSATGRAASRTTGGILLVGPWFVYREHLAVSIHQVKSSGSTSKLAPTPVPTMRFVDRMLVWSSLNLMRLASRIFLCCSVLPRGAGNRISHHEETHTLLRRECRVVQSRHTTSGHAFWIHDSVVKEIVPSVSSGLHRDKPHLAIQNPRKAAPSRMAGSSDGRSPTVIQGIQIDSNLCKRQQPRDRFGSCSFR